MVLTEPDAGSDVGAGRTKAKLLEDDIWEIEGVKRFITNGDFDGPENIVHMVLARPEGAQPGTRGLSLFLVPKFWVNNDGSLGERNGVYCTNLEKKTYTFETPNSLAFTSGSDPMAKRLITARPSSMVLVKK